MPKSKAYKLAVIVLVALMIVLRVVALRSDSFVRLDWSAGQMTDEGFYMHNARNVVLFGHARTDSFNSMLLSPALNYLQIAVFRIFGVGSLQDRMISVVCSLLSLLFFWLAMRRLFDARITWTAVIFLGLDHVSLLFNRMALMDTPATLPAVLAFYLFVRVMDMPAKSIAAKTQLFFCGFSLGFVMMIRSMCAWLLPAPLIAIFFKKEMRKNTLIGLLGFFLVMAVWAVFWYWPNHVVMDHMMQYYRSNQLQPHTWKRFGANLWVGFFGDFRGITPYVFRHTPVILTLSLLGILFWKRILANLTGRFNQEENHRVILIYFISWIIGGWAVFVIVCYSPARYYIPIYPAMAGLSSITLWNLEAVKKAAFKRNRGMAVLRASVMWFLGYHVMEALVHHEKVLPHLPTMLLLYGIPSLLSILGWVAPLPVSDWFGRLDPMRLAKFGFIVWFLFNGYWLGAWVTHIGFTQYHASRWLASHLPPNSVLIGDIAPGMCMDNDFRCVHVQDGLCNYHFPVERFAGNPRFIVILDGRWKERWWVDNYPHLVDAAHLYKMLHVMKWKVGIYRVPNNYISAKYKKMVESASQ